MTNTHTPTHTHTLESQSTPSVTPTPDEVTLDTSSVISRVLEGNGVSTVVPEVTETIEVFETVQPKKKFRLKAKKVFLTYKGWHKMELVKFIGSIYPVVSYMICNELGDTTNDYEHTHCAIEFNKIIDITNERKFDYQGIHPNIQSVRTWIAAVKYCQKENVWHETNVEDAKAAFQSQIEAILRAKTLPEALEQAESMSDVMPVIALFNNRSTSMIDPKFASRFENAQLNGWQQQLNDMLNGPVDDRKVYWFVDYLGGKGKTWFCNYREVTDQQCLVLANVSSLSNINDFVRNYIEETSTFPTTIIIDLPRTFEDRDSVYTIIEAMKNGRLTCTKYKGKRILMAPPHLVVFSNWNPDLTKLSQDRWRVEEL